MRTKPKVSQRVVQSLWSENVALKAAIKAARIENRRLVRLLGRKFASI